ncbi:MAG: M56 family metallopeptidase [Wenzhouxiangellaceae bacterium]|nr:M56 family metallopeptidase [Wenzhouxiangellaceae bacterium]
MTPWLDLLWLLLLLAAAAWALTVSALPAITRLAFSSSLAPAARYRRALLAAGLPWLVPGVVIASVCLLAAAKPLGWIADHCVYHGPGHPHLCFEHLPAIGLNHLHAAAASLFLTGIAGLLVRLIGREYRAARQVNALRALASGRRRLRIVEQHQPVAFAAGFSNPFVLLSRGLLAQLTALERRIVLAHEVAHLRHRDMPRNLAFEILLLLHTPASARTLRGIWKQALEEKADDRVAARYGDENVAATLLKAVRICRIENSATMSVVGADPLRRVRRLLSGADEKPGALWHFELPFVGFILSIAMLVGAAHHPLETLLGRVTSGLSTNASTAAPPGPHSGQFVAGRILTVALRAVAKYPIHKA